MQTVFSILSPSAILHTPAFSCLHVMHVCPRSCLLPFLLWLILFLEKRIYPYGLGNLKCDLLTLLSYYFLAVTHTYTERESIVSWYVHTHIYTNIPNKSVLFWWRSSCNNNTSNSNIVGLLCAKHCSWTAYLWWAHAFFFTIITSESQMKKPRLRNKKAKTQLTLKAVIFEFRGVCAILWTLMRTHNCLNVLFV